MLEIGEFIQVSKETVRADHDIEAEHACRDAQPAQLKQHPERTPQVHATTSHRFPETMQPTPISNNLTRAITLHIQIPPLTKRPIPSYQAEDNPLRDLDMFFS